MAPRHKINPRKVKVLKSTPPSPVLSTLHPHAAGIDIGARQIYVAVPPGACAKTVRSFDTFTEDLLALRDWLQECGVTSVSFRDGRIHLELGGNLQRFLDVVYAGQRVAGLRRFANLDGVDQHAGARARNVYGTPHVYGPFGQQQSANRHCDPYVGSGFNHSVAFSGRADRDVACGHCVYIAVAGNRCFRRMPLCHASEYGFWRDDE